MQRRVHGLCQLMHGCIDTIRACSEGHFTRAAFGWVWRQVRAWAVGGGYGPNGHYGVGRDSTSLQLRARRASRVSSRVAHRPRRRAAR